MAGGAIATRGYEASSSDTLSSHLAPHRHWSHSRRSDLVRDHRHDRVERNSRAPTLAFEQSDNNWEVGAPREALIVAPGSQRWANRAKQVDVGFYSGWPDSSWSSVVCPGL